MTPIEQPSTSLVNLQKKQARQKRLNTFAGVMVGIVLVVRGITYFIPHAPELKTCDDSEVQQSVRTVMGEVLVKRHFVAKVTGLSNVQTKQRTEKLATCTATISFSDSSKGVISYRLDPGKVKLDSLAAS